MICFLNIFGVAETLGERTLDMENSLLSLTPSLSTRENHHTHPHKICISPFRISFEGSVYIHLFYHLEKPYTFFKDVLLFSKFLGSFRSIVIQILELFNVLNPFRNRHIFNANKYLLFNLLKGGYISILCIHRYL